MTSILVYLAILVLAGLELSKMFYAQYNLLTSELIVISESEGSFNATHVMNYTGLNIQILLDIPTDDLPAANSVCE